MTDLAPGNDPSQPNVAPDAGRQPFDLPPVSAVEDNDDSDLSGRRPKKSKTVNGIIFLALMAMVIGGTIYYVVGKQRRQQNSGVNAITTTSTGIGLREDQTLQFQQLMTAMSQERRIAEGENKKILTGINGIQTSQAATEKRVGRLEEISADLVSRGLAREASHADAASLPESLQSLVAPAITYCQKALEEHGTYGWGSIKDGFSDWAKTQSPTIAADDIHRLYDVAQVSRESISDIHYDSIPQLSRKRIAMRIPREDMSALVHMIWLERASLPPASPGQLISLANLVARAESTTSQGPRSPDGEGSVVSLAEYQDLVVPRDIHIGFEPCKTTDVVEIVAIAIPYLTGGLTIGEQDPVLATYYETRAKSATEIFLKRQSERPSALQAALVEEGQRQARLPRVPIVIGGAIDQRQRTFAGNCLQGLILARAVREGVLESNRLTTWATEMGANLPAETIAGIDLTLPQRAYATITARDLSTPLCKPIVSEAMDRTFTTSMVAATKTIAAIDRGRFLVSAAIECSAAAVVAGRTGDQITSESISATISRTVKLAVAQIEAQSQVHHIIDDELIPQYAGLYEGSTRDWSSGSLAFLDSAIAAIDATLSVRLGEEVTPDLSARLIQTGRTEAETAIARTAALDSINRDLDRFAAQSPLTLMKIAREHSVARVNQAISAQTPRDIQIRTAYAIAREAIAIAQGKHRVHARPSSTPNGTTANGTPAVTVTPGPAGRPSSYPPGTPGGMTDQADDTIQVFHASFTTKPKIRYVTIPAGAYAEARIFSGVECELGSDKPEPMLINLDYNWNGPAGSTLRMKDLRLITECTAMGGAPRVHARIVAISYSLPNGSHISVPVDGWAVDNVLGEAGAIGKWNWNLEDIGPLGALNGILGGLAGLLKPNQQVTSVNTNVTIQQTETTPGKNLGEGAASGLDDTIGRHIQKTLDNIKPSVSVPNNQACTVIMKTDAILPIPVDVWNEVVEEVDASTNAGFVRN